VLIIRRKNCINTAPGIEFSVSDRPVVVVVAVVVVVVIIVVVVVVVVACH